MLVEVLLWVGVTGLPGGGMCFCRVVNVSGSLFGALVSFFCFGGSGCIPGIAGMTGIKEKSLDTGLYRYDG